MIKSRIIESISTFIFVFLFCFWTNPIEVNIINLIFNRLKEYNMDSLSLILISDSDLEEVEELPITRTILSEAIKNVDARYIIFDILFSGQKQDDPLDLSSITPTSRIVMSMVLGNDGYVIYPDPSIYYNAVGFSNISTENPLYRKVFSTISLGGALATLESISPTIVSNNKGLPITTRFRSPFTDERYKDVILLWPDNPSSITTYNLEYLLNGNRVNKRDFNYTILVGYEATGLVTYIQNPLIFNDEVYPATMLHAIEILSRRNDFYLLKGNLLQIFLFSIYCVFIKNIFKLFYLVILVSIITTISLSLYLNIFLSSTGLLTFYIMKRLWDFSFKYIKFKRLYVLDPLTGIMNRRGLDIYIKRLNYFSKDILYYMVLDIDWFKAINDTYGHPRGDEVIIEVANTLKYIIKKKDAVARIGGEEFCLVINIDPKINEEDHVRILTSIYNRIRLSIADKKIPHPTSTISDFVTISAGCSDTIAKADEALYMSKTGGRDTFTYKD